jgi:hypothetical protein
MNRWIPYVLTLVGLVSACVVYDDETQTDTASAVRGEVREPGQEQEQPPVALPLRVHPAGGLPGDLLIVSILNEDYRDMNTITSVSIYGSDDLTILTEAVRSRNEYLAVLDIDVAAQENRSHVLVTFEDGSEEFIEDAFHVVLDRADIPFSDAPADCPE